MSQHRGGVPSEAWPQAGPGQSKPNQTTPTLPPTLWPFALRHPPLLVLLTAPLLLLLLPLLLLPDHSTTQCKCHVVGTGALLHRTSFSSPRPPFRGQGHDRRRLSLPTPTPLVQQRAPTPIPPPIKCASIPPPSLRPQMLCNPTGGATPAPRARRGCGQVC